MINKQMGQRTAVRPPSSRWFGAIGLIGLVGSQSMLPAIASQGTALSSAPSILPGSMPGSMPGSTSSATPGFPPSAAVNVAPGSTNFPSTALPPTALPSDVQPIDLTPIAGDDYVLGPGDQLRVDFFSVPEFNGNVQVLPNGSVNLPRVGGVNVQGMTLRQAGQTISSRYRRYLTRPLVTLSLIAGRPVNVAIAGEINRSGSYLMNSAIANGGDVPTITRLIAIAEGLKLSADLSQVEVRRRTASGGVQAYKVDLWRLLKRAETAQDIRLQDGDSVYIPETATIDLASSRALTDTNIATRSNRPLRIAVIGEVNRPGPYTLSENGGQQSGERSATPNALTPSITQALQISGGITQMADLRNITVRRMTRSGREQVAKVDFWSLLERGEVLQDLPLQDGDRIEIARATAINDQEATRFAKSSIFPDRIAVNIVGEVERGGQIAVTPNLPLNQGILAAGGFNKRAQTKSVELVRLEPNGTVTKRKINIDLAQGVNEQSNPALRNGDTVIVARSGLANITDSLGILSAPIGGAFSLLRLLGIIR
jgi:polysaccharide biosynthesis/export protein